MTRVSAGCLLGATVLLMSAACAREADRASPRRAESAAQARDTAVGSPSGWLVGATPAEDLLRADASEAGLREQLGAAVVVAESVYVGEGQAELGTVLYPKEPARRLDAGAQSAGLRDPGSPAGAR